MRASLPYPVTPPPRCFVFRFLHYVFRYLCSTRRILREVHRKVTDSIVKYSRGETAGVLGFSLISQKELKTSDLGIYVYINR